MIGGRPGTYGSVIYLGYTEQIHIGDSVVLANLGATRGEVRIGIEAPDNVIILRKELIGREDKQPKVTYERPMPTEDYILSPKVKLPPIKRIFPRVIQLRACVDLEYYNILDGAKLILSLSKKDNCYRAGNLEWNPCRLFREIEVGVWKKL